MGDSDLTLGFRMPADAVTGMANIYVNVWTDETDGASLISTYPTANIQIIGLDPTDLGAFNVAVAGFPSEIGDTIDGLDQIRQLYHQYQKESLQEQH